MEALVTRPQAIAEPGGLAQTAAKIFSCLQRHRRGHATAASGETTNQGEVNKVRHCYRRPR